MREVVIALVVGGVSVAATGVALIATTSSPWRISGWILVGLGLFMLLMAARAIREANQASARRQDDEAHGHVLLGADGITRRVLTYPGFWRLPKKERRALLTDHGDVRRWFENETHRRGAVLLALEMSLKRRLARWLRRFS